MPVTSVLDPVTTTTSGHWRSRPALARLVRYGVFVLPLVLATTVGGLVAALLPAPTSVVELVAQWAVIIGAATVVVHAARPIAKRLLPLSALLELTLVFPDVAPSRTATALRRPSEAELQALVETTRRDGLPEDAAKAASTILTLVAQLSRHDRLTRGHSERVRVYAGMIAEELGMSATEKARIQWAGLLHDIGKLTVDGDILNKPGRLNAEEYEAVKLHTIAGAQMVEPLRAWLGDAIDAVGQHHERWDGQGYPNGLVTNQISLEARIIAVADVFDVITAERSYKEAFSPAHARQEIADNAGTQFDPKVVRAFLAISLGEFRLASGPMAALAQLPVLAAVASAASTTVGPAVGAAMTATLVLGTAAAMPAVAADDLLNQARWAERVIAAAPEPVLETVVLHATAVTDVSEAVATAAPSRRTTSSRAPAKAPAAATAAAPAIAAPVTVSAPAAASAPSTPAAPVAVVAPPVAAAAAAPETQAKPKVPEAAATEEAPSVTTELPATEAAPEARADAEGDTQKAIAEAAEDAAKALAKDDARELKKIAAELSDIRAELASTEFVADGHTKTKNSKKDSAGKKSKG